MARINESSRRFVFATASVGCGVDGITYQLRLGDAWGTDDPLVLANPSLFSKEPPYPFPLRTV